MKHTLKCLLSLSMLALPLSAQALLASCTVAATGITFPAYVSPGGGNADATGNSAVTCSGLGLLVNYTITLSAGNGTFASRSLVFATVNILSYNMFTDTGRTTIWGDGSAGTSTVSDSYLLSLGNTTRNYTVYGRVPGGQNKRAGTYTDTVTMTITF
ncbi:MAG: spore coat U domain-containing protein [Collimonas pratensis]|uniref:Csu type fimbrial protein n=1 Tax=Collimonas pratensis TaxID=279113 RepID=UPI003C7639DA